MNTEPLSRIGLTPGEIKVYLALLHLGTTTAGPIAKEARVARSKLYDILDRLAKKGVASHVVKNGTRLFSAADPERFTDFLRKKEEDLHAQQAAIRSIMPQLQQEYDLQQVKQEAQVFEGLEGLKNAREYQLKRMKRGDAIRFFGVPGSAYHHMEAYYEDWNSRRIAKGINSYTLFTDEARNHPYVKEKSKHKLTHIRFLPAGVLTHAWTEIYGDCVVIAINHKKPFSIVINNKYVAESYEQYFRLLWQAGNE